MFTFGINQKNHMGLWTFSPTRAGDRWRDGNGEKIWCFNMLKIYKLMLRKISGFEWGRKPTLTLTVMKIICNENLNLEKNLNRHKCFSNYLQRCRDIYLFIYYFFVFCILNNILQGSLSFLYTYLLTFIFPLG